MWCGGWHAESSAGRQDVDNVRVFEYPDNKE